MRSDPMRSGVAAGKNSESVRQVLVCLVPTELAVNPPAAFRKRLEFPKFSRPPKKFPEDPLYDVPEPSERRPPTCGTPLESMLQSSPRLQVYVFHDLDSIVKPA